MGKQSKAARLVPELDGWEDRDLEELVAMVEGLLEARKTERSVADATAENRSHTAKSKGHVETKTINGYGPYRYLRYWDGGKFKSQYLGKA